MEIEIEAVLVLSKKIKLRSVTGTIVNTAMQVFECENPYVLMILIETLDGQNARMDVQKQDLACELRRWLEGKSLRYPSVMLPIRIEEAINRFVRFGKTPLQDDLILWLLSRSELYLGNTNQLVFGSNTVIELDDTDEIERRNNNSNNEYPRTATAAFKSQLLNNELNNTETFKRSNSSLNLNNILNENATNTNTIMHYDDQLKTFYLTKKMLGKSSTLELLKKEKIKKREDAKAVLTNSNWTADQWRLCNEIEQIRKKIEFSMESRRKIIEIGKTRKEQKKSKLKIIQNSITDDKSNKKFKNIATNELSTLLKLDEEINEDIKKQKFLAQKESQTIFWKMAPNGFTNLRGKSVKGPVIGFLFFFIFFLFLLFFIDLPLFKIFLNNKFVFLIHYIFRGIL
jgi:hypothetical protein